MGPAVLGRWPVMRTPTTPLTEEEIADCEAALAEAPSVDGQRWYGVWTDLIERLIATIRDREAEIRDVWEQVQ
jgi:hypothetical protein